MVRWFCVVLALLGIASTYGSAQAGMLYVADMDAFGGGGGIIGVNTATDQQSVVSSGGYFVGPRGLALARNGDLLVADAGTGAIIEVNPTTGQQHLLSSGGLLVHPVELKMATDGYIYVVDPNALGGPPGAIIRVDPTTGTQNVVSSGGNFETVYGVALASDGSLLVGDRGWQASPFIADGQLIRVDPVSGVQNVVAAGGLLRNPDHLVIQQDGDILVADHDAFGGSGGIILVNPLSGSQTAISSGGYFAGGPSGMAVNPNGDIFVSDNSARDIVRVDPVTGAQTLVSAGGMFVYPFDMVFVSSVPEPAGITLFGVGFFCLIGCIGRRTRSGFAT